MITNFGRIVRDGRRGRGATSPKSPSHWSTNTGGSSRRPITRCVRSRAGVSRRSERRVEGEVPVAHVDMGAERRRVGQPSKSEPFRGLDARGRVMCEFVSDTSEAAGVLGFEDGSLKCSLELLVFEVERAALGMLAEASVRRGCEPFGVERQSHHVAEIEFRVPVEPGLRVRRADCELFLTHSVT